MVTWGTTEYVGDGNVAHDFIRYFNSIDVAPSMCTSTLRNNENSNIMTKMSFCNITELESKKMSSRTKIILDMCNNEDSQPKKLAKEAENVNSFLEVNDKLDILAMPVDIIHARFLNSLDPHSLDESLLKNKTCENKTKSDDNQFEHTLHEENNNNLEKFQPESNDDRNSDYQEVSKNENSHEISRSSSDLSNESLHVDKENKPNNVYLRKPPKTNRTFGVNIRKINQEKRMKGNAYLGYRKPANQTNTFHDTETTKRTLEPPCSSSFCDKSKKRQCKEIKVKNFFRCDTTLQHYIKIDKINVPVCKRMFLATFGLEEWRVNNWVKKSNHGISNVEKDNTERKGPGKEAGDPNVVDFRCLEYTPECVIYYKIDFHNDHQPLPQRTKTNVDGNFVFGRLHKERLKIKQSSNISNN
ncbi:hypothetical protein ILUMI_05059 [Ignelater luminosus]|uniref:Uncharacterized protein n=1 Tax=Ignelater luminosus TaxID=2038154 RepID=A0A8K0DB95_IGNLU|nr:hypothetical protein ILUMI_05059 [Ignelater luminosus]